MNAKKVEYFPRNLKFFFPRLNVVNIISSGIKSLSRQDLIGLHDLSVLGIQQNELTSIPSNLFDNTKKLQFISFMENKLGNLSSKLLKPLDHKSMLKIDFWWNLSIHKRFDLGSTGETYASIEELMEVIDANCKQPPEDLEEEEKSFSAPKEFIELWSSRNSSNFIVQAGAKKFHVHKCVLSHQSSVMAAMLENNMQERQSSKMTISDFDIDAVEEFLRCLYTGGSPESTNAMDIFTLASKYNVTGLRKSCEEIILRNIDRSNCFEVLAFGQLHDSEDLKVAAFTEIWLLVPKVQTLSIDMLDDPENLEQVLKAIKVLIKKTRDAHDDFETIVQKCFG